MAPSSPFDRFVRLLVDRHGLSRDAADGVAACAARRKGVSVHDIAAYVMDQIPLPRTAA